MDGKDIKLSQLKRIVRSKTGYEVILKKGGRKNVKQIQFEELEIDFGETSTRLNIEKAQAISTYETKGDPNRIPIRVFVRVGEETVATAKSELIIQPPPAKPNDTTAKLPEASRRGFEPPKGKPSFADGAQKVVYELPSRYRSFTLAAKGRYFVFHVPEVRKVIIMDVLTGKTAAAFPGISDDALVACSATKMVVVLPGQKLIQRFDLSTFKRDKIAAIPGKGVTKQAHMGANSNGPLLLINDRCTLVDIETLQAITPKTGGLPGGRNPRIRISHDGYYVGWIETGIGPVPYHLTRMMGEYITTKKFSSTSNAVRWAEPTADGSLVMINGPGVYDTNLNQLTSADLAGLRLFSTVDPRFFFGVRYFEHPQRGNLTEVVICTTADRRVIYRFPGFAEMAPRGNTNQRNNISRDLMWGKTQFHYVPWAGIIAAAKDQQKIILQKFNLESALKSAGKKFLYVDSVPPNSASRGSTVRYQISCKSSHGNVKYKLESGPLGMKVSDDGKLEWNVPVTAPQKKVQAIVSIQDTAGQNILHSILLTIEE